MEKKYIDAYYLMEGRVSNDPVVIAVKCAPAADVQEVKHSHWTQVSVTDYQSVDGNDVSIASMFCPNCKRWNSKVYLYGNPTEHVNYCPFCGAKMGGWKEE